MADPFADDLAIEIGDAPLPETIAPPVPVQPFDDRVMVMPPGQAPEVLSMTEVAQRARAEAIASISVHSYAMREQAAIERARSGAA